MKIARAAPASSLWHGRGRRMCGMPAYRQRRRELKTPRSVDLRTGHPYLEHSPVLIA